MLITSVSCANIPAGGGGGGRGCTPKNFNRNACVTFLGLNLTICYFLGCSK